MIQSAERVSQNDASDNYVYQRSILAYHKAAAMVSGDVLELGTGSGYGIDVIAPRAKRFLTIDKCIPAPELLAGKANVEFRRMNVPPLTDIPSESFDYVISFQVIEHIKRDAETIRELHSVLRPGGKLIISTPNRIMSLTRNPWHVREYSAAEFGRLLAGVFGEVETLGVFGNDKVAEYYQKNKESVRAVMKYDILRLQKFLPRWILKIPYDIMNRRNRLLLLSRNTSLTSSITMADYLLAPATDSCYDLYCIATKR
jgi:2-polyprenyl-3-methyl-5-hydroxy-6-metoxy-1,4-benzoquinol methylase